LNQYFVKKEIVFLAGDKNIDNSDLIILQVRLKSMGPVFL